MTFFIGDSFPLGFGAALSAPGMKQL
jgi:hypothetical protein